MRAFDQLHPTIREAIWKQGWKELRPLQVDAINAIFDTEDHLILSAATASGKTEAAFLPILSKIADNPNAGIRALYVSPLKALINDQFRRLEALCEIAQIPVHRWHGDVRADQKRKLRQRPEGILLITPESLESQCINYGSQLRSMYACLEFVVIDELHAFLEDVRGIHLRSLLSRIIQAAGSTPRRLGLSATLGDFTPAQQFLCSGSPSSVRVLKEEGGEREMRIGLKGYVRPAKIAGLEIDDLTAERAVASDIATRFRKGTNLVFFNSRGLTEELADLLNERARDEFWSFNPFRIHHGSLSKELREDTENELKGSLPVTALCTRTLEMGIDIGAVQCVGQVGAPWTVSSLVQRVGRSGRREGEAQILRMYIIDSAITETSTVTEHLFPELLRGIALVELALARWVETPRHGRKHFSTLIHQTLSSLRQTGGLRADALFAMLCASGAFDSVTKQEFAALLRSLAIHEIIQQMETGEVILAPTGEAVVESRDFYAAFASSEEYSIEHDAEKIGTLARDQVPPTGEHLLLAGRRWCVQGIHDSAKCVHVVPARGKRVPLFLGSGGEIAREVMAMMHATLVSNSMPPYLHADAGASLSSARLYFQSACPGQASIVQTAGSIAVLPWAGTAIHKTLVACAKADNLAAELSRDGLLISYPKSDREQATKHWRRIASGVIAFNELIPFIGDVTEQRFDDWVPCDLLARAYAREFLDLPGAIEVTRALSQS